MTHRVTTNAGPGRSRAWRQGRFLTAAKPVHRSHVIGNIVQRRTCMLLTARIRTLGSAPQSGYTPILTLGRGDTHPELLRAQRHMRGEICRVKVRARVFAEACRVHERQADPSQSLTAGRRRLGACSLYHGSEQVRPVGDLPTDCIPPRVKIRDGLAVQGLAVR